MFPHRRQSVTSDYRECSNSEKVPFISNKLKPCTSDVRQNKFRPEFKCRWRETRHRLPHISFETGIKCTTEILKCSTERLQKGSYATSSSLVRAAFGQINFKNMRFRGVYASGALALDEITRIVSLSSTELLCFQRTLV